MNIPNDKIQELFLKASRAEVCCSLNFSAGCEEWDVEITSPAPAENFLTRSYGDIECAIDSALEHLNKLLP